MHFESLESVCSVLWYFFFIYYSDINCRSHNAQINKADFPLSMPYRSTIPELAWLDVQLTKTGLCIYTYVHCVCITRR